MTFSRGKILPCLIVVAIADVACRDNKPQKPVDSGAIISHAPAVTGLAGSTGWDSTAGPVLILPVPGDLSRAAVVLPGMTDSTLAATSQFELRGIDSINVDFFNPHGIVGSAVLRVASQRPDASGCVNWPSGSLTSAIPVGWRIGLEKGRASGLSLDSLAAMNSQDSARFVTEALGATSTLGSSSDSAFRGLPFSVRRGYRIGLSPSPVIVAEVVRKINEEANPREEHTLFLAERETAGGSYRVKFSKRSAGREETLEASDVLAAVRLKRTNNPVIVITFEYEDGGKIGLLEKSSDGSWNMRWRSAYTGC
jgi:hypothetical protein